MFQLGDTVIARYSSRIAISLFNSTERLTVSAANRASRVVFLPLKNDAPDRDENIVVAQRGSDTEARKRPVATVMFDGA
ncbi:MAG: hypothetical protein ACRCWP_04680 [Shewanella sp.]